MLEAEIKTCKAVQKHINETIDRHDNQIEKLNGSLIFTTAMEGKKNNEGKWVPRGLICKVRKVARQILSSL